jgi:hypothetical protein
MPSSVTMFVATMATMVTSQAFDPLGYYNTRTQQLGGNSPYFNGQSHRRRCLTRANLVKALRWLAYQTKSRRDVSSTKQLLSPAMARATLILGATMDGSHYTTRFKPLPSRLPETLALSTAGNLFSATHPSSSCRSLSVDGES